MFDVLSYLFPFARKEAGKAAGKPVSADSELEGLYASQNLFRGYRLDGPTITRILDMAVDGYAGEQAGLFLDVREKEPLIEAHLQTRANALAACEWKVTGPDGLKKSCEELTGLLKAAKLDKLLRHLFDAVPTGYSGAVIDWTAGGGDISKFIPVHPEAFEFDLGGNPAVATNSGAVRPLADYHPNQFVFVTPQSRPGLPARQGLMRSLIWFHFFKKIDVKNWARFVEKFGIPFVVGKIPDHEWGDVAKRNALLRSLRSIGSDGAGLVTDTTAAEFMNAVSSGNIDAFERLARYMDEIFTLMILGQLASSDTAGGMSNGSAQDAVRQDILDADARLFEEAVTTQILEPLCRFRFGWNDTRELAFTIDTTPPEDQKATAETWKVLSEITGRKIDADQVSERFGVVFGEEKAHPVPQEKALLDLSDDIGRRERALESVVGDALRRTIADDELFAAWLGPVQDAIKEAFGDLNPDDVEGFRGRLQAFMDSLPGIYEEMDSSAFEENLSGAMLASIINGVTK